MAIDIQKPPSPAPAPTPKTDQQPPAQRDTTQKDTSKDTSASKKPQGDSFDSSKSTDIGMNADNGPAKDKGAGCQGRNQGGNVNNGVNTPPTKENAAAPPAATNSTPTTTGATTTTTSGTSYTTGATTSSIGTYTTGTAGVSGTTSTGTTFKAVVGGGGGGSQQFNGNGQIQYDKAPPTIQALKDNIESSAQKTGIPSSILAGVIYQESGGRTDVNATDGGTDAGLMQIDGNTYNKLIAGQNGLPTTADGKTPTDPATNILAGATYLSTLKQKFGTWDLALRAYNSGENGVDMNNPDATPAGTGDPNYLNSIRSHVAAFENGTQALPR